jgi:hypothetical protein
MGRKPSNKNKTVINGNIYAFRNKQILLRGIVLEMFNYDREYRDMTESQLGAMIIKEHYRRNPPSGFIAKD